MKVRWAGVAIAAALAGTVAWMLLTPSAGSIRQARIESLRAKIARLPGPERGRRPLLFGRPADGACLEALRAALKALGDPDPAWFAELEGYLTLAVLSGRSEEGKRLSASVEALVASQASVISAVDAAARAAEGLKPPGFSIEGEEGHPLTCALLLALADARLKAESGKLPEALDRCTAVLVVSQELGHAAQSEEQALFHVMLHHSALKALAILIDLGHPDAGWLAEARRRIDVLMHFAPRPSDGFERELILRRDGLLMAAQADPGRRKSALEDLALEAAEVLESIRHTLRSGLFKERIENARRIDEQIRTSANPLIRQVTSRAEQIEKQIVGLAAEHRIVMAICQWEIDRLKSPQTPPSLESIPDPFDGAPLRARYGDGTLVVYSVGPDLTDDRGSDRDVRFEIRR